MIWIARHSPRRDSAVCIGFELANHRGRLRVSTKIVILTNRAQYLAATEAAVPQNHQMSQSKFVHQRG